MAVRLTEEDRAVLEAYARLAGQYEHGAFAHDYPDVVRAAGGSASLAKATCRNLTRRKFLVGPARAQWITEKGREALKA